MHRSWVYRLKARFAEVGEAAFEPLSRRPRHSPTATKPETVELVLRLRKELSDAGADTVRWHLEHDHHVLLSRATVHRILVRITRMPIMSAVPVRFELIEDVPDDAAGRPSTAEASGVAGV